MATFRRSQNPSEGFVLVSAVMVVETQGELGIRIFPLCAPDKLLDDSGLAGSLIN
jgi:hypothetical protein